MKLSVKFNPWMKYALESYINDKIAKFMNREIRQGVTFLISKDDLCIWYRRMLDENPHCPICYREFLDVPNVSTDGGLKRSIHRIQNERIIKHISNLGLWCIDCNTRQPRLSGHLNK